MVRTVNKKTELKKKSDALVKRAEGLLAEQTDEDTAPADMTDILEFVVDLTRFIGELRKNIPTTKDLKR